MTTPSRIPAFRERLLAHQPLVGTFQKTPNATVTEILALSGLDCVCIDAEHAPFDRADLDGAIRGARGHDLPSLVRVPDASPTHILNAMDLGATGVVVPHVTSAADARSVVTASRYGRGGRGYSGTTRAAGFTTASMPTIVATANASVCVIAQIEDESAVGRIDEITAVDGIDCLFIGRMDLAISLGANTPDDPRVVDAVRLICSASRRRGRCVGMFTATTAEALQWRTEGASVFLLGSDQQWILQGARELRATFN